MTGNCEVCGRPDVLHYGLCPGCETEYPQLVIAVLLAERDGLRANVEKAVESLKCAIARRFMWTPHGGLSRFQLAIVLRDLHEICKELEDNE